MSKKKVQQLKTGINLIGYINKMSGLGHNARQIYKSISNTDIDIKQFEYNLDIKNRIIENPNYFNIICMNPDILNDFRQLESRGFICKNKVNIGLWAWEADVLPDVWLPVGKQFDEIWTVSEYSANVIKKALPSKPVHVINIMCEQYDILDKHECRDKLQLSDDLFICLYVFDFNSDFYRKNPDGVVKAFKKSFQNDEKVLLILKSINEDLNPLSVNRLLREINGDKRIVHINSKIPSEKICELYNLSDLYISLHRSEGSGLTIMEMLLLEKPIVCTNYSGNIDFCKETFTNLVDYKLIPVQQNSKYNWYLKGKPSYWADPDIEDAANKIRFVYDNYSDEQNKTKIGKSLIENNYNNNQLYEFVKTRLETYNKD